MAAIDVDQRDTSGESMRSHNHHQFENKSSSKYLVANTSIAAEEQSPGFGIVGHMREGQFDLTDEVAREYGDQTNGDRQEDSRKHSEGVVGRGQAEGAQCDGLDNGDDGEALPPETVEVSAALGGDLLQLAVVHLVARLPEHAALVNGPRVAVLDLLSVRTVLVLGGTMAGRVGDVVRHGERMGELFEERASSGRREKCPPEDRRE